MMCGSCFGAVMWAAFMMFSANAFSANKLIQNENLGDHASLWVVANNWRAAFFVLHAIDFLSLSAAKLMVLDRMSVFASPQGIWRQRRWVAAGRLVMAAVVTGSFLGLLMNILSASHYQKSAACMRSASAFYAASTTDCVSHFSSADVEMDVAGSYSSRQSFCEVAVLIVLSFVVVGLFSTQRVSARLLTLNAASAAAAAGRSVRHHCLCFHCFCCSICVFRRVCSHISAAEWL